MAGAFSSWLFLRVLGFIYFTAFASFATQVRGLIGSEGLVPAIDTLNRYRLGGIGRIFRLPTLFWLNSSDAFLSGLCWTGAALSILLMAGVAPLPCLILLWLFYLSLFSVSGPFLGYQWDILLLETGFLAIFLAPVELLSRFPPAVTPSPIIIVLLWWLLFRVMWSSGWTKIATGDRRWRDLSALVFHYETQPLPTPLAWHFHQLPMSFHRVSTAIVFAIELVVPFFILIPPLRPIAAALFIGLMILIQITGNYAFFNFLGIALCIPLFNDATLARFFGLAHWHPAPASTVSIIISIIPAVLILALSVPTVLALFRREPRWLMFLTGFTSFLHPFRLVNSYGLFSVMTIERPEIVMETSENGVDWTECEFKFKPGNVKRAPAFIAPHQPRLDWQMWFAAMGFYHNHLWVRRFMMRLMEREPSVEALLGMNPFKAGAPKFIRCVLYDYRFTNRQQRKATGAWWRRERRGLYSPELERNKA